MMKVIVNIPEGTDPSVLLTTAYVNFLNERFRDLSPREVIEAIEGLEG